MTVYRGPNFIARFIDQPGLRNKIGLLFTKLYPGRFFGHDNTIEDPYALDGRWRPPPSVIINDKEYQEWVSATVHMRLIKRIKRTCDCGTCQSPPKTKMEWILI